MTITCRCGQRWRLKTTTDQNIECPRCQRNIAVVTTNRHRALLWIVSLIAVLSMISTAGLLGYVVGRPRGSEVAVAPKSEPVLEAKVPVPSVPSTALPATTKDEPKPAELPNSRPETPAPEPIKPKPIVPLNIEPVPPKVGRLEVKREPFGGYKVGDVLNQVVIFSRKSTYQIAGVELSQGAKYSIQSSLTITKVNPDGSFVVEQAIRKTQLIEADADMKATLTEALEKAIGAKFEIAINTLGEATVKGVKDPIRVQEGQQAALGPTVRLWSLLDADAWKELAGLTFFQPALALKNKATWTKPVAHDWGPLGSWAGKTIFVAGSKPTPKSDLDVIDYGHRIDHKSTPAGAANQLPFQLLKAKFVPITADGRMYFNSESQRTASAAEEFRVRGVITAQIAGSIANVEMEEHQAFQLSITDSNEAKMVAQPKKPK